MTRILFERQGRFGRPLIKTLVGHTRPDEDVWAGFWIAERANLCADNVVYQFVRSGETLPGFENNPTVVHIDTGKGEFDTHGKGLGETCSAALLAHNLGIEKLPGVAAVLEWVTRIDNAKDMAFTDVRHHIRRIPRMEEVKDAGGQVDWKKVSDLIYAELDNIHLRGVRRHLNRIKLLDDPFLVTTESGIRVCSIIDRSWLKEAAFEAGADVVVWTQANNGGFNAGVAVNTSEIDKGRIQIRKSLNLRAAVILLRWLEGKRRGYNLNLAELGYWEQKEPVVSWYFHDSNKLILSGSGTHPLYPNEFTKITGEEIFEVVVASLD